MKNQSKGVYQALILLGLLLILTWSCKKEDPPTLTTLPVTEVTGNTAQSGGNITDDGGASVTSRGVVWSTSENPTMNNKEGSTSDGIGDGQFVSNLTGLSPGTTYYVRAYAVNSAGTAYGNQEQFTTVDLASVTTAEVTDISTRTATSGGNVSDDGGAEVTARGVVCGTSQNPTIESYVGKTTDGSGTGSFVSEITELSPGTNYYVRAYATNSEGTAYGEQIFFETSGNPCLGMPTFTDERDDNVYNTVPIGDQCWLNEDLKYLPKVSPSSAGSETEPHYYIYDYQGTDISEAVNTDNYQNYGVLYNWPAAMNGKESSSENPSRVQGVCPAGWHLPSHDEWTELEQFVCQELGNSDCNTKFPYNNTTTGWLGTNEGNTLKSCQQVDSPLGGECATSEHPRWNSHGTHYGTDQFGFSALPGGRRSLSGNFSYIGSYGYWWSSTEYSSTSAWRRAMGYDSGSVYRVYSSKGRGFSVRCVRDD